MWLIGLLLPFLVAGYYICRYVINGIIFQPLNFELPLKSDIERVKDEEALIIRPDIKSKVIIYCHGNGGGVTFHQSTILKIAKAFPQYSVIMPEYQGYSVYDKQRGYSTTIDNFYLPILETIRRLIKEGTTDIVLIGQSLGGAAVSLSYDCLTKDERAIIKKIVLLNTFTRLSAVAETLNVGWLVRFIVGDIDSLALLKASLSNEVKVLIINTTKDEVIPSECAKTFAKELTAYPKVFTHVIEGNHNEYNFEEVLDIIK